MHYAPYSISNRTLKRWAIVAKTRAERGVYIRNMKQNTKRSKHAA